TSKCAQAKHGSIQVRRARLHRCPKLSEAAVTINSAMDQLNRAPMVALGPRQSLMRRPWVLAMAAAAWLAVALLTGLWPERSGTDWDYTGHLAAAFGAIVCVLALTTFADLRLACLAHIKRLAPWMLVLAMLLGAWETVTAKLGLLP